MTVFDGYDQADVLETEGEAPQPAFVETTDYVRLPDMLALLNLYRQAVTVAVEAVRLERRVVGLSRLAINLEVLAYRQKENQQVFPVLGKELQRLARLIEQATQNLAKGTNGLARHAVSSAGLARRCEKFMAGANLSRSMLNHNRLHEVRRQQGLAFFEILKTMNLEIAIAFQAMTELERISVHIPVVATLLKIESAKCGSGGSEEIRDLSARLLGIGAELEQDLSQILESVEIGMKLLQGFSEEN